MSGFRLDRTKSQSIQKYCCKLSIGHLLPSNVKLRSFRSDGPYFDSLTVFEGGAAFGYLHRLLNTVCLNTRWYGNTNRGGGSGEGLGFVTKEVYQYFFRMYTLELMIDIDAIKRRFESLLPTVDERMSGCAGPNSTPTPIRQEPRCQKNRYIRSDSFHGEWNYTIRPNI